MGRADGPTRGKDGNVHLGDMRLGTITMVSHLPAMLPVAVGVALAFRIREEPRVAVGWFGEGASARGDAHEAMTLAGVKRLPMVFICDNNQFAYSTPSYLEFASEHIADRARGLRLRGRGRRRHRRARRLPRGQARDREGARGRRADAVECMTLRMEGHAVHDDAFYVPKDMFEEWAKADPIERFRTWLRDNADFRDDEEDELAADVKKLLTDAIKRADESPLPDPAEAARGVFAAPEDLDTPHHK